jgi:hypothetical protein
MIEVDGVGRNNGKPTRGPRHADTPLNPTAHTVAGALTHDWQPAVWVRETCGLTAAKIAAALRELREAGWAESRQTGPSLGARHEWRLAPRVIVIRTPKGVTLKRK